MVEKYSDNEIDLIGRCISVTCWNKRMERYCGKGGDENKAGECVLIIRSVLSDMKMVIQNQIKEGEMGNRIVDPVKDVLALEEALINMDKKLDAARKYIESEEFATKIARKIQELYPAAESTLEEVNPDKG